MVAQHSLVRESLMTVTFVCPACEAVVTFNTSTATTSLQKDACHLPNMPWRSLHALHIAHCALLHLFCGIVMHRRPTEPHYDFVQLLHSTMVAVEKVVMIVTHHVFTHAFRHKHLSAGPCAIANNHIVIQQSIVNLGILSQLHFLLRDAIFHLYRQGWPRRLY